MKIGLMFANSGPFTNPDLFAHLVTSAEKFGIESIWTVEHVVIPQDYKSPYPYSSSGKIPGGEDVSIPAALTKKLKLGTGILILPQRHPIYVAKETATIDQLSKGRLLLGIGSGWLAEEFEALGLDFHTRGAVTDESIKALHALWSDGAATFHGKHYNFDRVKMFPKPFNKSGIPIIIGGHSPAAARRAGRYGDGFFPAIGEIPKLKELFALMATEAQKAGRAATHIELSCMGRAKPDVIKAFEDIGIARVVVPPPAFDQEGLTRGLEKMANDLAKM
jgi:probable F420-dependent oxidoreductase